MSLYHSPWFADTMSDTSPRSEGRKMYDTLKDSLVRVDMTIEQAEALLESMHLAKVAARPNMLADAELVQSYLRIEIHKAHVRAAK